MAEFATHALLGAASTPSEPGAGALVGNACDGAQVLAAVYLSFKNRRLTTNIWSQWEEVPEWIRNLNTHLHSLWYPMLALFLCWWFNFHEAIPYVIAFFSHTVVDVFTHDEIASLQPFSGFVFRIGKTFHSIENMKRGTWVVVLAMIVVAFLIGIGSGAWNKLLSLT